MIYRSLFFDKVVLDLKRYNVSNHLQKTLDEIKLVQQKNLQLTSQISSHKSLEKELKRLTEEKINIQNSLDKLTNEYQLVIIDKSLLEAASESSKALKLQNKKLKKKLSSVIKLLQDESTSNDEQAPSTS